MLADQQTKDSCRGNKGSTSRKMAPAALEMNRVMEGVNLISTDFEESDTESEHELDFDPNLEMLWTENGIPRPAFHFTSNSGVQVNILKDVWQIFEYFSDDNLMDIIVRETNRYASQYISSNKDKLKSNSQAKKWFDSNEIRTHIGLLILHSICPKPESKMYFSRQESIGTPFFSKVIGERRFDLLLKFLLFVNNSSINPYINPKIDQSFPVLDLLKKSICQLMYQNKTAIDKSLITWIGRLAWKQYIPSKRRNRFGMKMFTLCESRSDYMYNILVYTGADTENKALYINEPLLRG
ncbi:unnamed protein product [Acanthoscelides obtectus]|uniref:PiggyBac transposable element-derived protein domain-containing protein n=1 Tax=Acanthoscelides obtectus TaxID=200917 RepID=A0A9P0LTC6_ACAOB|nr:unnamed protein product [Acanthoscelides obtectus]CAK1651523.1 PiggyBac transposable element-derived protein 4 [Acanthoscelides obtectus]